MNSLDDESQVAMQDILMASQRPPSAPSSRQSQQQQLPHQHRRRMRLLSSSPPPPPPPPPAPPRVPAAGWSGRYPHLDAVRVSALAHRQSIDVPPPSLSTAAGGESLLFGAGSASLLVPSGFSPTSPPALQLQQQQQHQQQRQQGRKQQVQTGLSAAEAASRAASTPAPPAPSLASAAAASRSPPSPAPATAVTSAHPSELLSPLRAYPPDDPRGARAILREAVAGLEAARARRGFQDSLLRDGPPQVNERYTARLQALKKHARAAISLTPRTRRPSNALADLVGMLVAAIAMAFATGTVYLAQRQGPQFGALYIMILVGGYVVKGALHTLSMSRGVDLFFVLGDLNRGREKEHRKRKKLTVL